MTFSIIVPVFNAIPTIHRCLDSLFDIDFPTGRFEVVLVDNGSTDGTLEVLRSYPFRVVHEEVRNSFTARNTGIRESNGDIIAVTDADCIVSPGWLGEFEAAFDDPGVMACGGRIVSYEPSNAVEEYPSRVRAHDNETSILGDTLFLPWADTANAAYRRGVFDEIGPFDDIHFDTTGDVDMGWRISLRGGRFAFCPGALVRHINRGTLGALMAQYRQYGRASVRLRRKYDRYYETVLGYGRDSGWNDIIHLRDMMLKATGAFFRGSSRRDMALACIQACVGASCIGGIRREREDPRRIRADADALGRVAPRPLRHGYIAWGRDDEHYLFDFATERRMVLNDFGLHILEQVRMNATIEHIVDDAMATWDAGRETIEADVRDFITHLRSAGLTPMPAAGGR